MDFFRFFSGFFALCLFTRTIDNLRTIMNLLVITSLLCSIYVIAHGGKGPGMLIDENDVASFLVMLLPVSYFLLGIATSLFARLGLTSIFFVNLIAIAATLSRGGMVGTLPTLFFIWYKSKRKILTLVFVIIAVFAVVQWGPPSLMNEFSSISNKDDRTANSRMYFWGLSFQMMLKKPVFGVGANSWANAIWAGIVPLEKNVDNITPHSLYFQLLSELGVVGTIVFLLFFVGSTKIIKNIFRLIGLLKSPINDDTEIENIKEVRFCELYVQSILTGIVGFMVCSLFISTLYYPHYYYYTFILVAIYNILLATESQIVRAAEKNSC